MAFTNYPSNEFAELIISHFIIVNYRIWSNRRTGVAKVLGYNSE